MTVLIMFYGRRAMYICTYIQPFLHRNDNNKAIKQATMFDQEIHKMLHCFANWTESCMTHRWRKQTFPCSHVSFFNHTCYMLLFCDYFIQLSKVTCEFAQDLIFKFTNSTNFQILVGESIHQYTSINFVVWALFESLLCKIRNWFFTLALCYMIKV